MQKLLHDVAGVNEVAKGLSLGTLELTASGENQVTKAARDELWDDRLDMTRHFAPMTPYLGK